MPAARRCSSSHGLATAALAAMLFVLGGCASQPQLVTARQPAVAAAPAAKPASKETVALTAARPAAPSPVKIEAAGTGSDGSAAPADLAWCRYLEARAGAKSAMLLSPTVSASIDNDQKASAKVSYDVVDIARARLERKSAAAACQRYYAADRITRMLYVTPQSLTYAGNIEKADYLRSRQGELAAISQRINRHVANGEMTAQLAAGLIQYIETIRSLEHQARAEAHRRESLSLLGEGDASGLDRQLTEAERALQEVDRVSRSLDAISVTLSAGVSRDRHDEDALFSDDSAYAKVTVSYRLGALSPTRNHYERLAEEARIEALTEPGHGSLWFTAEMARALGRVREGLNIQRERLMAAIAEAKRNGQKFSQGYEIELYQSTYRAQVDAIKLTADLRGIEGTLRDIDKIERRLRFR